MLREIIAFPIVTALAWVTRIVHWSGEVVRIDRALRTLFDLIVGVEVARKWRDDHVEFLAEHVAASDIEAPSSSEPLAAQVVDRWRRTEANLVRGETLLAFAVAAAAFIAPPWVAGVLVALLFVGVSVRLGVLEPLAFTDPDPGESPERLVAMHAWNGGVLAGSRGTGNVAALQLMQAIDPRIYDRYVAEVFVPKLADSEMTVVDVWDRMNPETTDILRQKVPRFDGAPVLDGDFELDRAFEFSAARASISGAKDSAVAKGTAVRTSLEERTESMREPGGPGGDDDTVRDRDGQTGDGPPGGTGLEDLSYRELQSLAKEHDVKANLSREEMTEQLSDELVE